MRRIFCTSIARQYTQQERELRRVAQQHRHASCRDRQLDARLARRAPRLHICVKEPRVHVGVRGTEVRAHALAQRNGRRARHAQPQHVGHLRVPCVADSAVFFQTMDPARSDAPRAGEPSTSVGAAGAAPGVLVDTRPSPIELQFARAAYIILQMWPALRQAVLEQWGGPESEEKRRFLLSHLCDEYGTGQGKCPDVDDLADLLDNYVEEEYDCQLEDDSAMMIAMHVCNAFKVIFEEKRGEQLVAQLEQAFGKVRKSKVEHQTQELAEGDEDDDQEEDETATPSAPRPPAPRPEPEIDEDGFETVVSRRRR